MASLGYPAGLMFTKFVFSVSSSSVYHSPFPSVVNHILPDLSLSTLVMLEKGSLIFFEPMICPSSARVCP